MSLVNKKDSYDFSYIINGHSIMGGIEVKNHELLSVRAQIELDNIHKGNLWYLKGAENKFSVNFSNIDSSVPYQELMIELIKLIEQDISELPKE